MTVTFRMTANWRRFWVTFLLLRYALLFAGILKAGSRSRANERKLCIRFVLHECGDMYTYMLPSFLLRSESGRSQSRDMKLVNCKRNCAVFIEVSTTLSALQSITRHWMSHCDNEAELGAIIPTQHACWATRLRLCVSGRP